jgi:Carboxypeptidase regulatory-like domain
LDDVGKQVDNARETVKTSQKHLGVSLQQSNAVIEQLLVVKRQLDSASDALNVIQKSPAFLGDPKNIDRLAAFVKVVSANKNLADFVVTLNAIDQRLNAVETLLVGPQGKYVAGSVVDRKSGAPIVGAVVTLLDRNGATVSSELTNDRGDFAFTNRLDPAFAPFALKVEKYGYVAQRSIPVSNEKLQSVRITLMSSPVP